MSRVKKIGREGEILGDQGRQERKAPMEATNIKNICQLSDRDLLVIEKRQI